MRTPGAILVVDLDHAVADIMTEILRDEGSAVSIAHDRAETIASIATERPALVLLDDHIASLNTAGLSSHIARQHHGSIPIVTTTTNLAVATALNARQKWACLAKPFSLDALLAHVTHYVPASDAQRSNCSV